MTNSSPIILISHHLSLDAFAELAKALQTEAAITAELLVLSTNDASTASATGLNPNLIHSCEKFVSNESGPLFTLTDLRRRFPDVPWGTVVAAERSFTDYSFLMGGTGSRLERDEYIVPLVLRLVSFFETQFDRFKPRAVITVFGDNIFTLIASIVAEEKGIRLLIPQPAFLNEKGALEAGYFANTRYLESFAMVRRYLELRDRPLTDDERKKAEEFSNALIAYDGNKTLAHIYKKSDFEKPVTPQSRRIISYLREQNQLNANIDFYKIDWRRKLGANLLRLVRRYQGRRFLAAQISEIPKEAVFYAMHFQPEASTLVNGIWYSNQVTVIEALSKALPLGYTLVVKEHPRGRGMRPLWQYKHMASLHNVVFSDLPSKEIVRKCQMVVSVSGSIGLEALAMRIPVLMLGRTFHTFTPLYYRAKAPQDLPALFHRVLISGEFMQREGLDDEIHRFLLAYLGGKFPFSPVGREAALRLVPYVLQELDLPMDAPLRWLESVAQGQSI
ncbi:MAG: hypothetical protein V4542_11075 [Pseudomonadota bacterium]